MQAVNQQSISEKQTDQTSTSRISDTELLAAGYDIMRQLALRFGGFKLRFDKNTGKVIAFDMAGSTLYYCRVCNELKLLTDMPVSSANGALCEVHKHERETSITTQPAPAPA